MGEALAFYLFSTTLLVSAVMVVSSQHSVHSVLALILAFVNAAGLFILSGAELLAMLLVIVYVGAVAVLFLFVVMMLDGHLKKLTFEKLKQSFSPYSLIGGVFGGVLAIELGVMGYFWYALPQSKIVSLAPMHPWNTKLTHAHALGQILYTDYFYIFQVAGMILLVSMIGAIVLTLRARKTTRRQDIAHQLERSPANTLQICKVPFHQGLKG